MTHAAVAALALERPPGKLMPKITSRRYDPVPAPGGRRPASRSAWNDRKQGGTDAATPRARSPRAKVMPSRATNGSCVSPCATRSLVLAGAGRAHLFLMPRFRPTARSMRCTSSAPRTSSATPTLPRGRVDDALLGAWARRAGRTIINTVQLTRLDCALASAGTRMSWAGDPSRALPQRVPKASRRPADDAGGACGPPSTSMLRPPSCDAPRPRLRSRRDRSAGGRACACYAGGEIWVRAHQASSARRWSVWAATATSRRACCLGSIARRPSTRSGRAPAT